MRAFYWNLLNNLDKMAGLKQLDKIYAVHGENKEALRNEIKTLLDMLCRVSEQFPFIPQQDQQNIISQAVISEEFNSLNAATIYKWLNKHRDKYFKESHHIEKPSAPPLTGEARQKKLAEWLEELNKTQATQTVAPLEHHEIVNEKRKMQSTIEWLKDKPRDWQPHRKTSAEDLVAHALHLEWIKANHHPHTGKPLPEWMPEKEWLERIDGENGKRY